MLYDLQNEVVVLSKDPEKLELFVSIPGSTDCGVKPGTCNLLHLGCKQINKNTSVDRRRICVQHFC